jgi:hypothetical protein
MAEGVNSSEVAEPTLLRRLRDHFGEEPAKLFVVQQDFANYERANLHLAVQELIERPGSQPVLVGIVVSDEYREVSLSRVSRAASAGQYDEGPVEHIDLPMAVDEQLACVKRGLYLLKEDGRPIALLVAPNRYQHPPAIMAEVMAADREQAERFVRVLARRTRHGKAYRGNVVSIELDCYRSVTVRFHQLPRITRDELILPQALLQRIERHTLSFTRHADKLRAAGRHLKRGILLFGPPGTGKTLTAMYLATQMAGRTVLIVTGRGAGAIETACQLARMLVPATVILEDVDLIGTERERQTIDANALLFELLNQMDGLANDADILFLLTTNRPDVLEPALASRPGRVDQAIEIPPPDADCRRRLFELYGCGMDVQIENWDRLVNRTDGVSGAFIRELLRKAAVYAAEENGDDELVVRDRHLEEALAELLVAGGALTQSLLGATRKAAAT